LQEELDEAAMCDNLEHIRALAQDAVYVVGYWLGVQETHGGELETTLGNLRKLLREVAKEAWIESLGLGPKEEAAYRAETADWLPEALG
jgi:hypothetical protein